MENIIKIAAAAAGVAVAGFVGYFIGTTHMYVRMSQALLENAKVTDAARTRILEKLKNNEFDGMTFDEVAYAIKEEIAFQQIAANFDK